MIAPINELNDQFNEFHDSLNEPSWRHSLRMKAFQHFKENLKDRTKQDQLQQIHQLLPKLKRYLSTKGTSSNPEIQIKDSKYSVVEWNTALDNYRPIIESYMLKGFSTSFDNIPALVFTAFSNKGIFYLLPEGKYIEESLVVNPQFSPNLKVASTNQFIHVEEGAVGSLSYKPHFISEINGQSPFILENTHINLESGSTFHYLRSQQFSGNTSTFTFTSADLKANSSLNWFSSDLGGKDNHSETKVHLVDHNASAKMTEIFLGRQEQYFNKDFTVYHHASDTKSLVTAKGTLNDKSRSMIQGSIHIGPDIKSVKTYLSEKVLLLSKESSAFNIPRLDIYSNKVKAGHACTISDINSDTIFYLMTRGLTKLQAEHLIVHGFLSQALHVIENIPFKESMEKQIEGFFSHAN
jgi:Fe-S cluster assembly protein SufD